MSEWKEYLLGEITHWFSGGTPPKNDPSYWNGNIPWISAKNMTSHKVRMSDLNITENGLQNGSRLAYKDDILLLVRGSGLFNDIPINIVESPVAFNQDVKCIRAKQINHQKFIYYWLKGNKSKLYEILEDTTIGAGKFDSKLLQSLRVKIPTSENEINTIVDIAEALYDKIDLLHRQNETLEKLAETIFRQWFVEEAQDDWEEHAITNYIQIVGGGTPKSSRAEYWDGDIPWLSGGDVSDNHRSYVLNTEKYITKDGLDNSSCKMLPKFATVISARGTVGKFCLLGKPMTFSQSNYGILPKFDSCFFFTYLLISYSVKELLSNAYGSVFDTITTKSFDGIIMRLPGKENITEFESDINVIFSKMLANLEQISVLEKQRDTLLPKLMSGDVRVKH